MPLHTGVDQTEHRANKRQYWKYINLFILRPHATQLRYAQWSQTRPNKQKEAAQKPVQQSMFLPDRKVLPKKDVQETFFCRQARVQFNTYGNVQAGEATSTRRCEDKHRLKAGQTRKSSESRYTNSPLPRIESNVSTRCTSASYCRAQPCCQYVTCSLFF